MYFVLLAAALAIMAGVVAVAMGRGGEMTEFAPDRPATPVRLRRAADVAALRLPVRLLGYQKQATDETLRVFAIVLARREAEIARLRAELAGHDLHSPAEPPASEPPPPDSPASSAPAASPAPPA